MKKLIHKVGIEYPILSILIVLCMCICLYIFTTTFTIMKYEKIAYIVNDYNVISIENIEENYNNIIKNKKLIFYNEKHTQLDTINIKNIIKSDRIYLYLEETNYSKIFNEDEKITLEIECGEKSILDYLFEK